MSSHREVLDQIRSPTEAVAHGDSRRVERLQTVHRATMADGVVPGRLKEASALAMSVVKHCDGCRYRLSRRGCGPSRGEC